jgi:hypothetical protein
MCGKHPIFLDLDNLTAILLLCHSKLAMNQLCSHCWYKVKSRGNLGLLYIYFGLVLYHIEYPVNCQVLWLLLWAHLTSNCLTCSGVFKTCLVTLQEKVKTVSNNQGMISTFTASFKILSVVFLLVNVIQYVVPIQLIFVNKLYNQLNLMRTTAAQSSYLLPPSGHFSHSSNLVKFSSCSDRFTFTCIVTHRVFGK